ncbi:AMP-binding protein, partial [Chitinophaga varians]|uniref:AMP-binding protein n=1 Tax=Chitinophaga varians TaxID=2202339 RepID=UPI00165ECB12
KSWLLGRLDNTAVGYPEDKTIVDLFKEQVARTPDNIALKYGEEEVTYAALDKQSDQVACLLQQYDVQTEEIIGLLMDRSVETVVGMLGILKAGGAYLPIDIDYPAERISYLIQDSGLRLLLSSNKLEVTVAEPAVTLVYLEDAAGIVSGEIKPAQVIAPSHLCYIIYTSGTTGNPKGVMVEHGNVVRLLFNDAFQFSFDHTDVWTMFHSHCFDFSVWEIYGAILYGGKVVIIPKAVARDTRLYRALLEREQVTVLNQTPGAFYNLIEEDANAGSRLSLRYVIFGGEALSPARLTSWWNKYPEVKLINMFGITETTVHVTYKEIGAYEIA